MDSGSVSKIFESPSSSSTRHSKLAVTVTKDTQYLHCAVRIAFFLRHSVQEATDLSSFSSIAKIMSTLLLVCLLVALATTRGLLLSPKMHIMANKVSASRLSSQSEDSLSVDNAAINLKVQSEDSNTQSIFSKGKKYMNAAMLGLALFSSAPLPMNMNSIQPAHAAGQTSTASLETSIAALETANGKTEVVQALADVFEAAESKTLLVRTKYKTRIIKAVNSRRANVGNEWDNVSTPLSCCYRNSFIIMTVTMIIILTWPPLYSLQP